MDVSKGSVVVFIDGFLPSFMRFTVTNIINGLLFLECRETMYSVGNIHPRQVKVVE